MNIPISIYIYIYIYLYMSIDGIDYVLHHSAHLQHCLACVLSAQFIYLFSISIGLGCPRGWNFISFDINVIAALNPTSCVLA